MNKFNPGERVYVMDEKTLSGRVHIGPIDCPEKKSPSYIIKLDRGFYNPERTAFVSVIVADESSIKLIPKKGLQF